MATTIKEIADLCGVDKRTVSNKIKKLHIEPQLILNRYELSEEQAKKIIKNICKDDYQAIFDKADFGKTETEKIEKNDKNNAQYDKNIDTENGETTAKTADNTADNGAETADLTKTLIEMLQKSLEDKESTIRAQQNQINALISANASLSNKILALEDKSQKDVVVDVPTAAPSEQKQDEVKKHWWQRIFS